MRKGTKVFVFLTAMILTVGGLKATIGHRYGYGQHGGCYNERFHHRDGMRDCHEYGNHDEMKPNADIPASPTN